ncbi:MAG: radical SAM protein [Planctomycetes bacterium]|nr:radical SAM protein [Planctomycetota bacterium]
MTVVDRIKRWLIPERRESLIVEVTPRCNLECLYCYNVWKGSHPYPKGELDTAAICRLLDKVIRETRCRHVTLTGGEPLMRKDLAEIVRFVRGRGPEVNVISNGTMLTEARAAELVDAGVSLFELPILSGDREVHDGLVLRKGSFDRVVEAISWIKVQRGRVVCVFVGTRRNLPGLAGAIELSIALGADGVMLNRFNPGGEGARHLEELLPGRDELRTALAEADRLVARYGVPIACSIPIQPCLVDLAEFPHLGFGFCAAGTERAYYTIDPLGNLRACNHTPTILGNLFDAPFDRLARSPGVSALADGGPESCAGCSMRRVCRGGCPAAAEACAGSATCAEPFLGRHAGVPRPAPEELARRTAGARRGAD